MNGRKVGAAWHAPFRINIGKAVKHGSNSLDIRVSNLWVNRLIGGAQSDMKASGAQRITWTSQSTYGASAPLRPSGLIGPVRILTQK